MLMAAMVLAVSTGMGSFGQLVFGGFTYAVLVGVVVLAFPILIFVMITIILLAIETSRATRVAREHWWSRRPREVETATIVKEPVEGRSR